MKKTKILSFALISFIALNLVSCSSDDAASAPTPNPTSTLNYYPSAINNQWVYITNGVQQPPLKMVSYDAVNGNNYFTFSAQPSGSGATATSRIRTSGSDYYIRVENITTAASGPTPGSTTTGSETILLKDNLPVGGTWNASYDQTTTYTDPMYPPVTINFDVTSTIIDKDISYVVGGITYTNVIKMQRAVTYTSAMFFGYSSTYYWFSKDVGPIRIETVSGSGTTNQELASHIIN